MKNSDKFTCYVVASLFIIKTIQKNQESYNTSKTTIPEENEHNFWLKREDIQSDAIFKNLKSEFQKSKFESSVRVYRRECRRTCLG